MHALSALGMCQFVVGLVPGSRPTGEAVCVIAGWEDVTVEELLATGERITNVRQAFNQREGLRGPFKYPDRMRAYRPSRGTRAGITFTHAEVFDEYLELMDWDRSTGMPSRAKLIELALDDIAEVLWPTK